MIFYVELKILRIVVSVGMIFIFTRNQFMSTLIYLNHNNYHLYIMS